MSSRLTSLLPENSLIMARKSPARDRILILGSGVHQGASGELLAKMVASLQAPSGGVVLEEWSGGIEPSRLADYRICVVLGQDLASGFGWKRGGLQDWNGTRLIVTESLSDLLERPALKRVAWEDLKLVMQEMGWKNP